MLDAAVIAPSRNLEFVMVDFENESLREALLRSRFDFFAPAFFSLLGVVMYLTEDAVDAVFRFVGSLAPSTEIVFSFTSSSEESAVSRTFAAFGEPLVSHFDEVSLNRKMKAAVFSVVHFASAEEISIRYFQGRTDLPAPTKTRLGSGIV